MGKRFAFKMPHSWVIVMVLLLLVCAMTYVIPAGEYKRVKTPTGITAVDPNSFHYVESTPVSPLNIPICIMKGMANQQSTVFALLAIGGALEVLLSTGMFHVFCKKLAMKCLGRQNLFICLITFIFTLVGMTQAPNRFIAFGPLCVMLAAALNCDAVVGVSTILLGLAGGFVGGMLTSTTAIAQEIAELPIFSGMWMRAVVTVLIYLSTTLYVIKYANKVRKDPTKSVLYGDTEVKTFEIPKDDVIITWKHVTALVIFIITFIVMLYGCVKYGWGITPVAACFIWMGIITGFACGYGPSEIAKLFVKGCTDISGGAIIVGLAGSVAVILTQGKILDTVVMQLAASLNYFPNYLKGSVLLFINTIVNFFIVSGAGQAAAVMPVLTPVCDLAGISRQTCVLAYKLGDGFSNYIFPHSSSLMGFLSAAGIGYGKWMKFMSKLFVIWMVIGCIILTIACAIGY